METQGWQLLQSSSNYYTSQLPITAAKILYHHLSFNFETMATSLDVARSLENVFVLIRKLLSTVWIIEGDVFRFLVSLAFVDLK